MQNEQLLRAYVRSSLQENKLEEGIGSTIGHVTLDLAGIGFDIVGAGEFFDGANALWYAQEGDFINAAFSLISCIPAVGDVIGKGGKAAMYMSKLGKAGAAAKKSGSAIVKIAKLISENRGKIDAVLGVAKKNKKLAPYVDRMNSAIGDFVAKTLRTTPENVSNKAKQAHGAVTKLSAHAHQAHAVGKALAAKKPTVRPVQAPRNKVK